MGQKIVRNSKLNTAYCKTKDKSVSSFWGSDHSSQSQSTNRPKLQQMNASWFRRVFYVVPPAMRDADIRSTEHTKRVSFTRKRLRYEFKLAAVFWLKLLLVTNVLNSFRTRRRSITIRHCVLFTVSYKRNAAHGSQGLCCYLTVPTHLVQAWPTQ